MTPRTQPIQRLLIAASVFAAAALHAADLSIAGATPPPKKRITVCQPYAEKCPACVDCSRCVACAKQGNRCSVRRTQLGFVPR